MGFNKKRLPPLEEAKTQLAKVVDYLNSFEKADAWIGPVETARFLEAEISKHGHGVDG